MSRIGKLPIAVPKNVKVALDGRVFTASGPKGKVAQPITAGIDVEIDDGTVVVTRSDDSLQGKAKHGLTRALLANAVKGALEGWSRELEIQGVGFRAESKGSEVHFALGYSHPVVFPLPQGIDVAIEKQTHLTVSGIDKQLVGQVAANMRSLRKPDPYKQKGVRYTGEVLKKKAGKAGAK